MEQQSLSLDVMGAGSTFPECRVRYLEISMILYRIELRSSKILFDPEKIKKQDCGAKNLMMCCSRVQ